MRWPETSCVGQKFAGKVRGCITSGIPGAPTHSGVSHKVQESEIRNQEAVLPQNQEAILDHKAGSNRILGSHTIRNHKSVTRGEKISRQESKSEIINHINPLSAIRTPTEIRNLAICSIGRGAIALPQIQESGSYSGPEGWLQQNSGLPHKTKLYQLYQLYRL